MWVQPGGNAISMCPERLKCAVFKRRRDLNRSSLFGSTQKQQMTVIMRTRKIGARGALSRVV